MYRLTTDKAAAVSTEFYWVQAASMHAGSMRSVAQQQRHNFFEKSYPYPG